MAKIQWDLVGEHIYEGGIDRGVLYDPDGKGVGWNGIISFDEVNTNTSEEIFYDGIKINDLVTIGSFSGTLKAFTYPDNFHFAEGIEQDQDGVFVTGQPQYRFGLCYRTRVGNDLVGLDYAYKIHLLYNLTAIAASVNRETLALEEAATDFSWKVTGIPETLFGRRPTCHLIIDSREIDPWLLQDIEDILYGDEDSDPTLPDMDSLLTFIRKWERLIITDHNDGTWSADSQQDSDIVMVSETEFLITAENVVYYDEYTYDISSSDKNEEDID